MLQTEIAICSQKGGVGKTTLSLNLALAFAQMGHQTTIVELDPQGSLGASLLKPSGFASGIVSFFNDERSLREVILNTSVPGLSLLPFGEIDPVETLDFENRVLRSNQLSRLVDEGHAGGQNLIIFDCPAGFSALTQAVLRSVRRLVVPIQAEPLSLRALGKFLRGVESIQEVANPDLSLLGLVLTMFDRKCDASFSVVQSTWESFDASMVFETVVPRQQAYLEASLRGVPVGFMSKGTHPEGRRYQVLAQEVLSRLSTEEQGADDGEPIQTLL
jgi:chromosome partitioning protein